MNRTTMMTLALMVLLSPGLVCTAGARTASKIAADSLASDFGTVDETTMVEHTFILSNEGDAPLEIRKIETSCGCTATQVGGTRIMPGASTPLTAKINLRGRRGRQEKSITVTSNDPDQPTLVLKMAGNVVAEVEVSPLRVDFLDLKADQAAERVVTISSVSGPALMVTGVEGAGAPFVTARSVTLAEGKSYQIRVQTNPPLSSGVNRGIITVTTDNPKYPSIYIPVSLTVSSDLVVVPNGIMIPYGPGANPPITTTLVLRSRSGKAFKILRVESPASSITTRVLPDSPSSWKIEVANLVPEPRLNGAFLRIFTEGPGLPPETRVPLQIFNQGSPPPLKTAPAIFK